MKRRSKIAIYFAFLALWLLLSWFDSHVAVVKPFQLWSDGLLVGLDTLYLVGLIGLAVEEARNG